MTFDSQISSPLPGLKILDDGSLKITTSSTSSNNDFNFLTGRHQVHHKKLKERLTNSNDWKEFQGGHEMNVILNGFGNIEKYLLTAPDGKPFEGMNLRLFDPITRLWSIYWADSINGNLGLPVVGSFNDGVGHFYATDTFQGKTIIILFKYDSVTNDKPTWAQAFSSDHGKTWEWNWQMNYT